MHDAISEGGSRLDLYGNKHDWLFDNNWGIEQHAVFKLMVGGADKSVKPKVVVGGVEKTDHRIHRYHQFAISAIMVDLEFTINNEMEQKPI